MFECVCEVELSSLSRLQFDGLRAHIHWKHLHGTHTHRCADQSEVHSHDDRSRDMSQEC